MDLSSDIPNISSSYRVGFRDWLISWTLRYDPEHLYSEEPEEVPLFQGRNRAWWNVDGPTQARCLPNQKFRTQYGVFRAICDYAPQKSCSCGLYAQHLPQRINAFGVAVGAYGGANYVGQTYGAVLGWGRRFRHGEEGFRAEFMKPVAFWIAPRDTYHRPPSSQVEVIVELADRLDAKIFSRVADMAKYAFTLGETWHPLGQHAVDEYFGERRWSRGIHDDVRD